MTHSLDVIETANRLCALQRCEEAVALWQEASSVQPGNPQIHYQLAVCYSRDCHNRGLRDSEIAIYHYRQTLSLLARESSLARAMLLGDLGNTYLSSALPSKTKLLTAIDCFGQAAEIYREFEKRDDWAREQYNLGNAWCEMTESESPSKWEKAIAHFEEALSVRTREKDAERYAATLQNLGTAYRELKTGNRSANLRRAINCYHRAMRALRKPAASRKRADLHHNLGNVYLTLAIGGEDRIRNLGRATRHLARALDLRTKLQVPFDYAATQFSRGEAFLQLAISGVDGSASLNQARACFKEACEGFEQAGRADLANKAQLRLVRIAEVPAQGATDDSRDESVAAKR
jgi:tetratricopeptide (TPR) repeat protein